MPSLQCGASPHFRCFVWFSLWSSSYQKPTAETLTWSTLCGLKIWDWYNWLENNMCGDLLFFTECVNSSVARMAIKFLLAWLHSCCSISPTAGGTCQKWFTKYHDWRDATQCTDSEEVTFYWQRGRKGSNSTKTWWMSYVEGPVMGMDGGLYRLTLAVPFPSHHLRKRPRR